MTDQEREELRIKLHGSPGATAGQAQAHGHAQGRAIPFADAGSKTRPLLISSGKGGVGKSSVTTNLAVALAQQGHSVGVVDADIYGYSIPRMLGTDRPPVVIDEMIVPPERWGVRCISIGYFVPEGEAVIWRGPMLHKALEQFLTDVFWDEPEFLLIDMPPGTGDIALSLSQYLPRGEVYVVTTPQPAAQKVARLSAAMAAKVNLPVKGVIENMSWFTGDDGKRYELFGSGGGQELAELLAAARPEQLVALAVVAGEPRHVLDHALDRQIDLDGHRRRQPGDLLRRRLRRRDDVDLATRQVLAEAEGDVAGARRHVDQQELGRVPVHVGQELLERLVQHRSAPDHGLVLGHEVPDRDAAHAPAFGRHDHLVDHDRRAVGAEHAGDRVAVDVGVDDADRVPLLGEGDGEVGRDARLADAALAGRDQQRPRLRSRLGERDRPPLGVTVGMALAGAWRRASRGA